MLVVLLTGSFQEWLDGLRDLRAQLAIARRIDRVRIGNLGDARSVGGGVSELRVDVGSGYRLYFVRRGGPVVVIVAGGDKASQARDIKRARKLADEV